MKCTILIYYINIIFIISIIIYLNNNPKIHYSNINEWNKIKYNAFIIIKNEIDNMIIYNQNEYNKMLNCGLTFLQKKNIKKSIINALFLITKQKNREWVYYISNYIIYSIDSFINGLINTEIWINFYEQFSSSIISKLIYNIIIWKLGNDKHYPGILDNIPIFSSKL